METEPVAYLVGDAEVRIRDVVDADSLPAGGRIYYFEVKRNGKSIPYRADVHLSQIVRFDDQQLAEYLVRNARRVRKLTS